MGALKVFLGSIILMSLIAGAVIGLIFLGIWLWGFIGWWAVAIATVIVFAALNTTIAVMTGEV